MNQYANGPHHSLPFTGGSLELVLLLGIAVAVFALAGLAIWSERTR